MSKKFDLQVPEYNGKHFSWSRNVGVAEASELGLKPGRVPHSQCYSDACDEGINIRSFRTGAILPFYLKEEVSGGWEYASLCGTYAAIILND